MGSVRKWCDGELRVYLRHVYSECMCIGGSQQFECISSKSMNLNLSVGCYYFVSGKLVYMYLME